MPSCKSMIEWGKLILFVTRNGLDMRNKLLLWTVEIFPPLLLRLIFEMKCHRISWLTYFWKLQLKTNFKFPNESVIKEDYSLFFFNLRVNIIRKISRKKKVIITCVGVNKLIRTLRFTSTSIPCTKEGKTKNIWRIERRKSVIEKIMRT